MLDPYINNVNSGVRTNMIAMLRRPTFLFLILGTSFSRSSSAGMAMGLSMERLCQLSIHQKS